MGAREHASSNSKLLLPLEEEDVFAHCLGRIKDAKRVADFLADLNSFLQSLGQRRGKELTELLVEILRADNIRVKDDVWRECAGRHLGPSGDRDIFTEVQQLLLLKLVGERSRHRHAHNEEAFFTETDRIVKSLAALEAEREGNLFSQSVHWTAAQHGVDTQGL